MAVETEEAPVQETRELTEDEQVAKMLEAKQNGTFGKEPSEEKKEEKKEDEPAEKKEDESAKPEDKKEEKKSEESEPDELDSKIKELYEKEYEISSKKDLDEILDSVDKVLDERDQLRQEVEKLKGTKPELEFESEGQKSAFNFIKSYDPDLHRDALSTWATVIGMDVEKSDGKSILRENFILSRPDMTRQDAVEKFERDYNRKYVPKKEKFDSDEEYDEARKDAEIDRKADEAAARKALKDKQKEFQYKPTEKKEEAKKEELSEDIRRGIERTAKDLDAYHKNFSEIIFAPTEKEEDNFAWKPDRELVNQIKSVAKAWVSDPKAYDKNGKLAQKLDSEEVTMRAAYFLAGDEIAQKLWEHAEQVFTIKRADEIGKREPDRISKVTNASTKELSEDEQVRLMIEEKEKKKR